MPAGAFINTVIADHEATVELKSVGGTEGSSHSLVSDIGKAQGVHVVLLSIDQYIAAFPFGVASLSDRVIDYHIFHRENLIIYIGWLTATPLSLGKYSRADRFAACCFRRSC